MPRVGLATLLAGVSLVCGVARAQPANDECGDATVIAAVPFTDTLDVTGATHAFDDPTFDCLDFGDFGDESTVWYRYTAPTPVSLLVDTFGSDFDTALVAHGGGCGAFSTLRTCSDDEYSGAFFNGESQLLVTLDAGETVFLEVLDRDYGGGTLVLNVTPTPVFQVSRDWLGAYGLWSTVAPVADGGFLVVWFDDPGGPDGIVGRRFDAAGAAAGPQFQVNATPVDYFYPDVAAAAGDFVAVWGGTSGDLVGRRFGADGTPLGTEFTIAPSPQGYGPQVTADAAGNFLVVWTNEDDVFARRFDAAGVAQGPAFMVNTYTTGQQVEPAVAVDGAGNFVVVWEDESGHDGSSSGVFGQRLDGAGNRIGAEFQVNTDTVGGQSYPVVAANVEGSFMVFWWDADCFQCVDGRFFDDAGLPGGDAFRIDGDGGGLAEGPPLAATADAVGNFLVVWPSDHFGGAKSIFGQHIDPGGTPAGPMFQVTHIDDIYQYHPDVAPLAGGDFVVVWDWSPFSSHYNVFGRVVDGLGLCPATPSPGCHVAAVPGAAKLTIKDRSPDKGDGVVWKWVRGDETLLAELGDPTTSDAYTLCLYDATGKLLDLTVPPGGTCGSNPCWRNLGADGFKFVSKGGGGAMRKVVLVPGADSEARVIVKAKGEGLIMPSLPLTAPLEARLLGPGGVCWATTFAPADVTINTPTDVKAKGGS